MQLYEGNLRREEMGPKALSGYRIWCSQRQRCHNRYNTSFDDYGGRGIRVKYDAREFLGWWMQQDIEGFKHPMVALINESGHYELGNIKIVERGKHVAKKNAGKKLRRV